MLVGIEVAGDGPGGRIGSEGELGPFPDNPEGILRNRIPVTEAQAVVDSLTRWPSENVSEYSIAEWVVALVAEAYVALRVTPLSR